MLAFHEFCTPDERQEICSVLAQLFGQIREGMESHDMFEKWKRLAVDPARNYLQIKNKVHSRDEGGTVRWCLNVFYEEMTYHVYVRRHCLLCGTMSEKPGARERHEFPYEMRVKTENVVTVFEGNVTWFEQGSTLGQEVLKEARFW